MKTSEEPREKGSSAAAILEAAERLCGERGLEAVSIRDIAKAADVSLSVIYHHFGSKAELIRTLLRRRLDEFSQLRNEVFTRLESDPKPDLKAILHAIFAPVAQLRAPGGQRQAAMQFLARALVSPLPEVKEESDAAVRELRRVVRLLQRALPHLSHAEICWRLHFTFGIEHMTHWDDQRLLIMSDGECDGSDAAEQVERAIAYAQAAFLAPPLRAEARRG